MKRTRNSFTTAIASIAIFAFILTGFVRVFTYGSNGISSSSTVPAVYENTVNNNYLSRVPNTEEIKYFDFDSRYTVLHNADQKELDQDFVIELYGDYYHHNTNEFLNDIRSLGKGDIVKIDNHFYSFNRIERAHAYISDGYGFIISESGNIVEFNKTVEIVTCASDTGSQLWNRYIVFLDTLN